MSSSPSYAHSLCRNCNYVFARSNLALLRHSLNYDRPLECPSKFSAHFTVIFHFFRLWLASNPRPVNDPSWSASSQQKCLKLRTRNTWKTSNLEQFRLKSIFTSHERHAVCSTCLGGSADPTEKAPESAGDQATALRPKITNLYMKSYK